MEFRCLHKNNEGERKNQKNHKVISVQNISKKTHSGWMQRLFPLGKLRFKPGGVRSCFCLRQSVVLSRHLSGGHNSSIYYVQANYQLL